jgi:MFS family permease
MSSFHGMWSLGGLIGAAAGGPLLAVLPPPAHALIVAAALAVLALAVLPHLLPGGVDRGAAGPAFARPHRGTFLLGLLAFLVLMSEGAMLDWSAVHLRADLGTSPALAAAGFAAFSAAMAVGRFAGDRLRQRLGAVTLTRAGALLAAAGLGLGLLLGTPLAAVAGFAAAGLGLSNQVPVLFGAAGRIPDEMPARAIAAVATLGYAGFLAGPPLIGFVAEAATLAQALGLVVLACAIVGLSAAAVRRADADLKAAVEPDPTALRLEGRSVDVRP